MLYKAFVPNPMLLIPVLIITTKGTHTPKIDTNSDSNVIVKYAEHAEAYREYKEPTIRTTETTPSTKSPEVPRHTVRDRKPTSDYLSHDAGAEEATADEGPPNPEDDIIFIPNDQELVRNEDYLVNENLNMNDLLSERRTLNDVLNPKNVKTSTDTPDTDIIFVMGKNKDNAEEPKREKSRRFNSYEVPVPSSTSIKKLNCTNLNCNNNLKSMCGGKLENERWKYRLFLNECYFRKVNCNFKSPINRYKEVPIGHCKTIGLHSQKPFSFKPQSNNNLIYKPVQVNNTRRVNKSSRRSMTLTVDGQFCSHPCPVSCSDHYAPECAVSATGRHRVFINHCALDHNSCSFGVVWHKRPLSECVGGKKADVHQNAGFIGWMQRVGIVDKRGRLVLS